MNVSVTADGALHWNDDTINEAQLTSRLEAAATQQPQPEIFIRGDRKVDYERVVKVMAAVQKAGVLKLGFVTEPGG